MTANQIAYARLKEEQRSHLANEEINAKQAGAAERQAAASLRQAAVKEGELALDYALVPLQQYNAETQRINASAAASQAAVANYRAKEDARHNRETEYVAGAKLGIDAASAIAGFTTKLLGYSALF